MSEHELKASIEELYSTFNEYKLEPDFSARCSPLGDRVEIAKRLMQQSLRETDAEDTATYAYKAMLTMGEESDFMHFLPRFFDLMATEPEWFGYDPSVFEKLKKLDWQSWPSAERSAIEKFMMSLWKHILEIYPWHTAAMVVLLEYATALENVDNFLAIWDESASLASTRNLASATDWLWDDDIPPDIKDWFMREAVQKRLEAAYYEYMGEEFCDQFSSAIENLEDAR